jgi:hypothetical protein
MRKSQFPWILAIIEVVASFAGGIVGLVIANVILAVIYLLSLRVHPRIRHGRCAGTGEHRGAVFTWTHRKCGRCNGGRLIRWGAGRWGSEPIRNEYRKTAEARATARRNGTWR